MSENGKPIPALETMCPINPLVRPGECQAIYAQLEDIKKNQRQQGNAIANLRKENSLSIATLRADMSRALKAITEQLAKLVAAHGGKGKKSR